MEDIALLDGRRAVGRSRHLSHALQVLATLRRLFYLAALDRVLAVLAEAHGKAVGLLLRLSRLWRGLSLLGRSSCAISVST